MTELEAYESVYNYLDCGNRFEREYASSQEFARSADEARRLRAYIPAELRRRIDELRKQAR